MDTEKISIIIPIYNAEKHLRKCINSLINQSYSNTEIILIDDGSTDKSLNICNEYGKKYSNIKVIHQENQGVSAARNNGINNSTGNYIGFVDADDYIEEKMLEKMMFQMIKNNLDIVICNLYYEDENFKEIEKFNHNDYEIDRNKFPYEMYSNYAMQGYVCNKLYRKSIIENKKIRFDTKYIVLEDDLFNYIIFFNNKNLKIKYIDEKLYHYVKQATGASKSPFNIKKLSYLSVRNAEIEILEKEKVDNNFLKADYICAFKRMKFLSKKNHIFTKELFNEHEIKYKKYLNSINVKKLDKLYKFKYIIVRYFSIIYYLKIIFKY